MFEERSCVVCGKTFVPKVHNQICCSHECINARRRETRKGNSEPQLKETPIKDSSKAVDSGSRLKGICPVCGKSFLRKSFNQMYCSSECNAEKKRTEKKPSTMPVSLKCQYCGKVFKPKSATQKYCSDSCGKKYRNALKLRGLDGTANSKVEAKKPQTKKELVIVESKPGVSPLCKRKRECMYGGKISGMDCCDFNLIVGRSKIKDKNGLCTEYIPKNESVRKEIAIRSAKGVYTPPERIRILLEELKVTTRKATEKELSRV